MEFLSKELVALDYRCSLQRDLGQAKVCRFLIAYVSGAGVDSINRPVLLNALRDPRSFGDASLSCSCKYEPLLKVQDDLSDVRLKYFMDPVVLEQGEPSEIGLFHSKLVYLYLPRQNKSIVYLGSHNWTRRALGLQGPRNSEASMRLEFDFEEDHLDGIETFLGNQLTDISVRESYYRESRKDSMVADLDLEEDVERSIHLTRLKRVYTAPVKDLIEEWRECAAELRPKEHPRKTRND